MPYGRVLQYVKAIKMLNAEEALTGMQIASFPHLKKEKAKKVEKDYRRMLRLEEEAPKSTEDLYHHMLRTLGNG